MKWHLLISPTEQTGLVALGQIQEKASVKKKKAATQVKGKLIAI